MEYDHFIEDVRNLDFIRDRVTADAAVKAVLGIIASRMSSEDARQFTSRLPDPLNLDVLRSHQRRELGISPEEQVGVIRAQFKLTEDQAQVLVDTVLRNVKEAVGEETFSNLSQYLPSDWMAAIQRA